MPDGEPGSDVSDDIGQNKKFRIVDATGMEVMSMMMGSSGTYHEEGRFLYASGDVFVQVNAPVTYDEQNRTFLATLPGAAFRIENGH